MKKKRVLIVEDDCELRSFLAEILHINGYTTCLAGTFNEAILRIDQEHFDLAILDIMLDESGNGIEVLKYLRQVRGNGIPVIMQTAVGDDAHCVRCLKSGADEFVVKPVRAGPLLARIEAVLRRASGSTETPSVLNLRSGVKFDYNSRELIQDSGERIHLSYKENQLLRTFYERRGKAISEGTLLVEIWKMNPALAAEFSGLRSLVSRLRTKLGDAAEIKANYAEGYRLEI